MHPPDELMVERFLPSMRQLVAVELRRQGYSQSRIAGILGITQASVSHYLSSDPARAYRSLGTLRLSREECDSYTKVLADDARRSPAYSVETLRSIWLTILGKGLACDAHILSYPALAGCDVCVKAYGSLGEVGTETISEVAKAVKLVESSPAFAKAMPEVSVNLACAPGDSRFPDEVVAVPGRIVRVRGRGVAMRQPEFGASGHMAKVLLSVRSRRKDVRAVINLKYDGRMSRVLKRLKLRTLEIGDRPGSGRGDSTVDSLVRALAGGAPAFDVVVDLGGSGIEPNVYLFGKGADEVARLALRVSEIYSAS